MRNRDEQAWGEWIVTLPAADRHGVLSRELIYHDQFDDGMTFEEILEDVATRRGEREPQEAAA